MLYFANPCGPDAVAAMVAGRLGFMDTPQQGNTRPAGVKWAADNGAFGQGWPGEQAWLAWLVRNTDDAERCAFASCPDAICDHQRTYRRSDPHPDRLREMGYRPAFVAQNGAQVHSIDWKRYDALFIGGDTEWKFSPVVRELVAEAKRRGMWVHMGRVNSGKRWRYAEHIGCDSADGTYLVFGPIINTPKLLYWTRPSLFTEVAS